MTEPNGETHVVDFTLWTTYIGLDLINPSSHPSFTLFDLTSKSIQKYTQQQPKLHVYVHSGDNQYWCIDLRYLLLLSETFRKAVRKDALQQSYVYEYSYYWAVPRRFHHSGFSVLLSLIPGRMRHTEIKHKSDVLSLFEWLELPIMCKERMFVYPCCSICNKLFKEKRARESGTQTK